ncbi:LysR family transcriptional regulator [Vibrio vulnificus]|nr:LysR family transcriptional regulator [Vibrio vulnificus]EKG2460373.1 LysR family transcriptional regulator [Vibrio vulnificus]
MSKSQFIEVRHFVTVVQLGSFTLAAQALGMTGSALSKSVARLEKQLGTKLLHRTTRRIALTNDGDSYFADCLKAMTILEKAEKRLNNQQLLPSGRVRIDLPAVLGRRTILPKLLELASKYEQLDLSITFNDRPTDLVSDGIDLAIRVGHLENSTDIVARKIGEQKRVICASPYYLATRDPITKKEDLAQHDCIVGWPVGQRHSWLLKNIQGITELIDISPRHEIADCEGILQSALSGAGLVQLPVWLVKKYIEQGQLSPVLDSLNAEGSPISIVWLKTPYIPPKIRIIIDEIIALSSRHPDVFEASL